MEKANRVFELDALRGLSIFMMICHHLIWDIRYLLGYDTLFKFERGIFFTYILQPLFLCCFIMISGVCCTFSRNNLKRSLRLLLGAVALSVIMALVSFLLLKIEVISDLHEEGLFVFFNILHLLTVGTFICFLIEKGEKRATIADSDSEIVTLRAPSAMTNSILIVVALMIFMSDSFVRMLRGTVDTYAFLPLGIYPYDYISMGDYLPLIPWLGVFLIGMVLGRILYANKKTAFPGAPKLLIQLTRPFEFIGRHALFVYLIHQPILLAILFGGRYSGLW